MILCRAPSVPDNRNVMVDVTLDKLHYSNSSVPLVFTALEQFMMFGRNDYCQLTFSDTKDRLVPEFPDIADSQKATDVALGQQHILAVAVETKNVHGHTTPVPGRLWVAGDNRFGQLGTGDKDSRFSATIVKTCIQWDLSVFPQICSKTFYDLTITKVAAGMFHSLALASTGELFAWGWNNHMQLGLQGVLEAPNSEFPVVVWPLKNAGIRVVAMAGGQAHSAAISDGGDLYTWGQNDNGQLGTGDFQRRGTPTRIAVSEGLTKFVSDVKCGLYHTVVLTSVGQVWVMGSNLRGQLGLCKDPPKRSYVGILECHNVLHTYDKSDVITINVPSQVQMLQDLRIAGIGAGSLHSLAITNQGDLFAWGDNRYHQLGMTSLAGTQLLPALVRGLRTGAAVCVAGFKTEGVECISPTEFLQRGVRVLTAAGGDQHTILTAIQRRPWGTDGAFVDVPRTFVVGDGSFGQLGLGNRGRQQNFVTIRGSIESIAVKGLTAAYTQSAVIIKCLPLAGESCSDHGSCSKNGICTCLTGYRGADCSMECRGGHKNVCSGKGGAAIYPKIARYWKAVVVSLVGGNLYTLMRKIMATAGSGDISRIEVTKTSFASTLLSILANNTAIWYPVADLLGEEFFYCDNPPCSFFGEELPFTPPFRRGLAWQFMTERDTFVQSGVVSALYLLQTHATDPVLLSRLFGVRHDDGESAIRNFNRECLSCDWNEAAYDTNILVTPLGYPDLTAYAAWSVISDSSNVSLAYGLAVTDIDNFRSIVTKKCLSTCSTLPAEQGCMGDGSCLCQPGYTGIACNRVCPGGFSNPCSFNGRCTANATCLCDSGWRGTECQQECPGGYENPCSNHGVCLDDATCLCDEGYKGYDCSRTCEKGIAGLLCSGPQRGICTDLGVCICGPGFRGSACQIQCKGGLDVNGNECSGNGVCLSTPNPTLQLSIGDCKCNSGYRGSDCSRECDGGAQLPCAGHGICTTLGNCDCSPALDDSDRGWRGQNCSLPCTAGKFVNTSFIYSDPVIPNRQSKAWMVEVVQPCSGNGVCSKFDTSCLCNPGYRLSDCSRECNGGHLTPCSNEGECGPTGECKCKEVRRGKACELLCPGGYPVCRGRGICDAEANCICTFMYQGLECERIATWLLVVTVLSVLFFVLCVVYTARRAYVLHRRRKRRRRRKVRTEEKGRVVRVAKGGRITEYSVVAPDANDAAEVGIDIGANAERGIRVDDDEVEPSERSKPQAELFGTVRAIAKFKLLGKDKKYTAVSTKILPERSSSSDSDEENVDVGSRAPVIEMQRQAFDYDASSSTDTDSDY